MRGQWRRDSLADGSERRPEDQTAVCCRRQARCATATSTGDVARTGVYKSAQPRLHAGQLLQRAQDRSLRSGEVEDPLGRCDSTDQRGTAARYRRTCRHASERAWQRCDSANQRSVDCEGDANAHLTPRREHSSLHAQVSASVRADCAAADSAAACVGGDGRGPDAELPIPVCLNAACARVRATTAADSADQRWTA